MPFIFTDEKELERTYERFEDDLFDYVSKYEKACKSKAKNRDELIDGTHIAMFYKTFKRVEVVYMLLKLQTKGLKNINGEPYGKKELMKMAFTYDEDDHYSTLTQTEEFLEDWERGNFL